MSTATLYLNILHPQSKNDETSICMIYGSIIPILIAITASLFSDEELTDGAVFSVVVEAPLQEHESTPDRA